MFLLTVVLLLAALLDQSLGQDGPEDPEDENTGSGITPELQQQIVNKHNEIRKSVRPAARNMLKMVWNETIGERARRWAEKCRLQMSPKEDRKNSDYACGEIIFQANYVNSWLEVIDYWKEKRSNFKYGVGAIDPKLNVYSYTQLIWYNSYQLGCAAAYCPGSTYPYFYVCQYCPAGNLQDQIATPYKKGKPCGDCPVSCENRLCTNPCKYKDSSRECPKMKELFSCKSAMLKSCQATCSCKNEIV